MTLRVGWRHSRRQLTARLASFRPMWSQPVDGTWTFAAAGATVDRFPPGGDADLTVAESGETLSTPVALDVLFLLDATGSMGDEIDRLKASIDAVAERVAALEGSPDVRLAMTIYRDEGDTFVTSTYDFTSDVAGIPCRPGRGRGRWRR